MTLRIYGIAASRAIRPLWAATELGLNFEHVPTDYKGRRGQAARTHAGAGEIVDRAIVAGASVFVRRSFHHR